MLKPAEEGTGVIAGGSVRPILELASRYKDIRTKVIGTNNPRNVVYATLAGLKSIENSRTNRLKKEEKQFLKFYNMNYFCEKQILV